MRLLYVPLSPEMLARLCQIAERERRAPREQAAYLLERALERLSPSGPARADEGTSGAEERHPVLSSIHGEASHEPGS